VATPQTARLHFEHRTLLGTLRRKLPVFLLQYSTIPQIPGT
jgi:hypothetical protein